MRAGRQTRPPGVHGVRVRDVFRSTFATCLVSASGGIRRCSKQISVMTALAGQHIGLEEVNDGIWDLYFATAPIGTLDVRTAAKE